MLSPVLLFVLAYLLNCPYNSCRNCHQQVCYHLYCLFLQVPSMVAGNDRRPETGHRAALNMAMARGLLKQDKKASSS